MFFAGVTVIVKDSPLPVPARPENELVKVPPTHIVPTILAERKYQYIKSDEGSTYLGSSPNLTGGYRRRRRRRRLKSKLLKLILSRNKSIISFSTTKSRYVTALSSRQYSTHLLPNCRYGSGCFDTGVAIILGGVLCFSSRSA